MNTLRVELSRLLARRLIRILALIAVAGMLVAAVIVFFKSNPPSEFVERRLDKVEACMNGEVRFPKWVNLDNPDSVEEFCTFRGPYVEDPRFQYADMPSILMGTSGVWMGLALLVGASFIGAEWHSGNIGTTLTWEPRRIRLYLAKALAFSIATFVATLLLQMLLALFLAPAAILRGSTEGVEGDFWGDVANRGLRAAFLAVAIGLLGFGLASIGRNTGAALGVMFAYTAVIETMVRAVRPQFWGWLLTDNIVLLISDETTMFGEKRSVIAAFFTISAYVLIPLIGGLLLFKRRDVT